MLILYLQFRKNIKCIITHIQDRKYFTQMFPWETVFQKNSAFWCLVDLTTFLICRRVKYSNSTCEYPEFKTSMMIRTVPVLTVEQTTWQKKKNVWWLMEGVYMKAKYRSAQSGFSKIHFLSFVCVFGFLCVLLLVFWLVGHFFVVFFF